MAIICEENRERRAKARLSGLMKQIEASWLLALKSGAFRRLPRRKGLKMFTFPAPSLLTLAKNHLDHFIKINRSRP
jgi:hypothetical protein